MRCRLAPGLLACSWLAGCGVQLEGSGPLPDGGNQPLPDGGADPDGPPDAAPLGPWGTPMLVPGASTGAGEDDGSMSSTTNELVFAISDPNANNTKDLWYMSRRRPRGRGARRCGSGST